MRILVTGGAGFIGSNFVRHLLETGRHRVVNLDSLTYAGNLKNLADLDGHPDYDFVRGDISRPEDVAPAIEGGVDAIVNLAAETHVDRSILDSASFVGTNLVGTQVLLEAARRAGVARFLQVSTDEVYGSLGPDGAFREDSPLLPNSPYSASKAGADLLVRSYHKTYGLETVISRCSNNYGPFQFPEKFIPLMTLNALEGRPLPVYGDGRNVRDWIHVKDHCAALETILTDGRSGSVYNVGAETEKQNLSVLSDLLEIIGASRDLIEFVQDRPAHDRRYAIDSRKIREELGWAPRIGFEIGLRETVYWYRDNPEWVDSVRSGEYRTYYKRMYEERDETLSEL